MIKVKIKNKIQEIQVPNNLKKDDWQNHVEDWKSLGKILINNSNRFSKIGINVMGAKRLGSGAFGNAYLLKDGKVLKITKDTDEAVISNFLINKNAAYIVKIFNVVKLPILESGEQIYAILQEKLSPLSSNKGTMLENNIKLLKKLIGGSDPFIFTNKSWEEIKKIVNEKDTKNTINFLEKIGFANICNNLKELKIKYVDFHSGNFMLRNDGTLVLIDIGADSTNFGSEQNIKQI